MKKTLSVCLLAAAVGLAGSAYAVDLENVSSGSVVPGEWNSNFSACKSYAESNGMPMLVFWSNPGCAQCNKMKTACNTSTFVEWRKSKGIVMMFSEGDPSVKAFAKNSSGKFPYMRLYWPAGGVDVKFTGRSGTIQASGSTLQTQFINYLNAQLKSWNGSGSGGGTVIPAPTPVEPTPSVPVVGAEWKRARKLVASYYGEDGNIAGRVLVIAGKANAVRKTAKVKIQVMGLDGKTKTIGYSHFSVDRTTKGSVGNAIGGATVSITGSSVTGSLEYGGKSFEIKNVAPGGSMVNGDYAFDLESWPSSCEGMKVVEKYLPLGQTFSSSSSRWSFRRRSGTIKYDQNIGDFTSAVTNPSALKLTYKTATGFFKGTFEIFAEKSETKVKKYKATVTGFMVGDEGSGVATVKRVGSYNCTISPAE